MLSILSLMISYTGIFLLTTRINKRRPGITMYSELQPSNVTCLNYFHAMCITVMIIPFFTPASFPLSFLFFPDKISAVQAIAFFTFFGTINFFPWGRFVAQDKKNENNVIAGQAIFLYAILRSMFLITYELFFRGLLLAGFSNWLGVTWSVIINLLLYTLIHYQKSKKEIIGCLPWGILLCVFTVWWQSVWPAVVFHLQIAMFLEWPTLQKFISPSKQATI